MSNVWAVCKKEIKTYFTSPIAYVVLTVFLFLFGLFFQSILLWFSSYSMQMAQNPYYLQQMNINQMVYPSLFHNISVVLLFLIPLLTMRLFSEEKKIKTDELLYTSPISINQIILGKYLSSLFVLSVMLLLSGILSIFAFVYGNPEVKPILVGYLGLFLMGAAFLAIGIFYSSLTENQVVSAALAFGTVIVLLILNWASIAAGGTLKEILNYISFTQHFDNMTKGILDTTDIVYYLSFVFLGLFLTHSVIQSQRWR